MRKAVELQNVSFAYSHAQVLKDVSFSIGEGEFVGLIGPNGGGKTTLLKLIMGFLKSNSGTVEIFGRRAAEELFQIAYVPQGLQFDRQFPISVIELVLSGRLSRLPWFGIYSAQDREAANKALEKVGLLEFSDRPFGLLSGGQAQRALIARALVSEPKLLLLDEPTASVDSQAEALIYSILSKLKGSMTIIMVTHDLRAIIDIVGRVLCVQGGILSLLPGEICEHFALGLYHTPLKMESKQKASNDI
jgi:zinc transport system ATP-binding protein